MAKHPTKHPTRRTKRGAGEGTTQSIFVVRFIEDRQLVGVYTARSIEALSAVVDQTADASLCEYTILKSLGITWPSIARQVPDADEDDPEISDRFEWAWDTGSELDAAKWHPIADEYVYFIGSGSLVKIGTTKNLTRRLADLQAGTSEPVSLIKAFGGGRTLERQLHQRFAALRTHGEWFRNEGKLADFLGAKETTA